MSQGEREPVFTWEKLATKGELAEAVVEFVRERDWVTFIELSRYFQPFINTEGNVAWESGTYENVFLWAGMSEEWFTLLVGLVRKKQLFFHPAEYLTYLIDGGTLRMPFAKSARSYKTPRWLPVTFRLVPLPEKRKNDRRRPVACDQ